jgi:hypothetical protein
MKFVSLLFLLVLSNLIFSTTSFTIKQRRSSPTIVNMSNKFKIEQGIGIEGCKLESPSGINIKPIPIQIATFTGAYVVTAFGTGAILGLLHFVEALSPDFYSSWKSSFALLGPIYMAAGAAHFSLKSDFENVYPYKGAWGIWYLPGSAEFHVAWTGYAELFLGG